MRRFYLVQIMDRKASIKSITADTVTIAGYGVVFGGSDLDGETFTKDTDFMLDLVPNKLTLYDHRDWAHSSR